MSTRTLAKKTLPKQPRSTNNCRRHKKSQLKTHSMTNMACARRNWSRARRTRKRLPVTVRWGTVKLCNEPTHRQHMSKRRRASHLVRVPFPVLPFTIPVPLPAFSFFLFCPCLFLRRVCPFSRARRHLLPSAHVPGKRTNGISAGF